MAYWYVGASPAYSTFRAQMGFSGQMAMSSIRAAVYPFNNGAMSTYRNQYMYRYNIRTYWSGTGGYSGTGGTVRMSYPYTVGATTTGFDTSWFYYGNPPYITITASATYPRSFNSWRTGGYNEIFLSSSPTFNLAWNSTTNLQVTALFT
jgi:hypothetical protein